MTETEFNLFTPQETALRAADEIDGHWVKSCYVRQSYGDAQANIPPCFCITGAVWKVLGVPSIPVVDVEGWTPNPDFNRMRLDFSALEEDPAKRDAVVLRAKETFRLISRAIPDTIGIGIWEHGEDLNGDSHESRVQNFNDMIATEAQAVAVVRYAGLML